MDKTNSIIVLFGSFFITLFFMSLFMPNARIIFNDPPPLVAQMFDRETGSGAGERLDRRIEEERREYNENREDEQAEYYRNLPQSHDLDSINTFEKDEWKEENVDEDLMR